MEALIVIDVQKGCLKIPGFEIKTKIEKINMLLDTFHEKELPVFFIQHNGIKENYLLPGTEDFDLEESLQVTDIRQQTGSCHLQIRLLIFITGYGRI